MLPIIKLIEEHILSLPEKELVALSVSNKEQDFQLSFTNIEDLRNQVFNEITSGYEEAYHIISKNVEIAIANLSIDDKEDLEAIYKKAREMSDKELLEIAKAGFKDEGVSHYKIDDEEMLQNIKHNIREGASNDFNLTECYESYKYLKFFMKDEYVPLFLKMGLQVIIFFENGSYRIASGFCPVAICANNLLVFMSNTVTVFINMQVSCGLCVCYRYKY
jgi:hypothetical protein